jgi:hypothetical protein
MLLRRLLLPALLAGLSLSSHAAVVKIDVGTPLPRMQLLKPGTHHYLRYLKTPDGANRPADIWTREVRFDEREGKRQLHIVQRWDGVAPTPSTKTIDAWYDAATFRPYTEVRILEKDGKRTVEGFVFAPGRISGMQDLADNTRKALDVASSEPTFNFETDLELLQTLALAEGLEARIHFYHPGGPTPPQRYAFKVTGAATVAGPTGPVDCWVVTTDYNHPGETATFWFAKGSQLMLRQEGTLPDGRVLVKTLID